MADFTANSPVTAPRFFGSGTAHVAGDYTLSGGWGNSATVSAVAGRDNSLRVSITCNGTGIAANPTVTLTFKDGTWTTIPGASPARGDIAAPIQATFNLTTPSATAPVFTFTGTPVAGNVYIMDLTVQGKQMPSFNLRGCLPGEMCLGVLTGANMNSTADQSITIHSANYIITAILVTNASVSLTTAAGGIYTGAGKTGTVVVAAAQVYSALTAATKQLALTLNDTDRRTATTLFLSLTTGQGVAATADFYVYGRSIE